MADKGYDSNDIRDDLKRRKIKPVIPPRSNRKTPIRYDRKLYKTRNGIERHFVFSKHNRRIAQHVTIKPQPRPSLSYALLP
ncbi:MAG TPA: transposase [Alphaproteobacteria bacterium]|nr:transposase [Alphaproteobacteria bacterium]